MGTGTQTLDGPTDKDLNRSFELLSVISERGKWRHESRPQSCPAELDLSSTHMDRKILLAELRSQKGTQAWCRRGVHRAAHLNVLHSDGLLPGEGMARPTPGLTDLPYGYSTKPTAPGLNRAHMSEFIHYEPAAEGLEFVGFDEPQYSGQKGLDQKPNALGHSSETHTGDTVSDVRPTILGPPELRERLERLC